MHAIIITAVAERGRLLLILRALVFCGAALPCLISSGSAGAQAAGVADGYRCLRAMNRIGASLVRTRGRMNAACLKDSSASCENARPDARQDWNARLIAQDAVFCPASSQQPPQHAYSGTSPMAAAAAATARGLMQGLFGTMPRPDALSDKGARCQAGTLSAAQRYFDVLWRLATQATDLEFGGSSGGAENAGRESLEGAVLEYLEADPQRRRERAERVLVTRVGRACSQLPSIDLFPGCDDAGGAGVADCATRSARCQFCQSLNVFDDLRIDCDDFDDGAENESCEPPLCAATGSGVNHAAATVDCPQLSDYQLFLGDDPRRGPDGAGLLFEINMPLFTDYAQKRRVIFLPPGTAMSYSEDDVFSLPVGTIIAKTFSFLGDLRDPESSETVIETRLLIRRPNGWDALPFIWTDSLSEAHLQTRGGSREVNWIGIDGEPRATLYQIPSRGQCWNCHAGFGGLVPIGPKARMLNRDGKAAGDGNQLALWTAQGALSGAPSPASAPRLPLWDDAASGTVEDRARAYLDANCAHCHRPDGMAGFTGLRLGWSVPTGQETGICKTSVAGPSPTGLTFDITPGEPEQSILVYRMSSTDAWVRMPLVGRSVVHDEGLALIEEWILSLDGDCD